MTIFNPENEQRCARCGQWWITTRVCHDRIDRVSQSVRNETVNDLIAKRDALRAEVESLTQQLKTGESFHAVAVQQRDTAWREAESLRAEVERLRGSLRWSIREIERNTCRHEETHRAGAIWTICDRCNRKWADDRGGFVPYVEPPELLEAHAALDAARAAQEGE